MCACLPPSYFLNTYFCSFAIRKLQKLEHRKKKKDKKDKKDRGGDMSLPSHSNLVLCINIFYILSFD